MAIQSIGSIAKSDVATKAASIGPQEQANLSYMMIAAALGDIAAPFRTFMDSWFAYHVGGPLLSANSRPHWLNNPCPVRHRDALLTAHWVSANAALTLAGVRSDRLVKDHAVPVSVLRDQLMSQPPADLDAAREFMIRNYRIGIITIEEDDALTAASLRSRMPSGWRLGDSPFARYDAAGICIQELSHGSGK